ncbi:MAG: diguanylate cyclase domain-containing protein [Gaiellales bacterium]
MQSPPAHAPPRISMRANKRISGQIRRFALAWVVAAIVIMAGIAVTRAATNDYREQAQDRVEAAQHAQQAEMALEVAMQRQVNDRLAWEITRAPDYATVVADDIAVTRRGAARLAASAAGEHGAAWAKARALAALVSGWNHAQPLPPDATHGRHTPLPAPRPHVDARATQLDHGLSALSIALGRQAAGASQDAAHRSWQADTMRLTASLLGLLVLLIGGAMLLQKAWRLAVDADTRREREHRFGQQIEAVLTWSSQAKAATTRSQLIGFAHLAPKDAIGASCLAVAEGSPPSHPSHGLARLTLQVDDGGEGLHVSVCFTPGRGDELDHHTLDLLLGHLAALWRTVLRHESLEQAAGHDVLTGLPNRRAFEAELRRRVGLSRRRGLGFTLAIVDLDNFKLVNDRLGHPEGDAVLRRAGEAVRAVLRGSDRIFRLGGEEFGMLLETVDGSGVEDLLERSREAVKALGVEPAPGRPTSASIGWAVFPDDADDRATLVAAADTALYQAKNNGRDRVVRAGSQAAAA